MNIQAFHIFAKTSLVRALGLCAAGAYSTTALFFLARRTHLSKILADTPFTDGLWKRSISLIQHGDMFAYLKANAPKEIGRLWQRGLGCLTLLVAIIAAPFFLAWDHLGALCVRRDRNVYPQVLDFYRGLKDNDRVLFKSFPSWSDVKIHNFLATHKSIEILFPNNLGILQNIVNFDALMLNNSMRSLFQRQESVIGQIAENCDRFLNFLGFQWNQEHSKVIPIETGADKPKEPKQKREYFPYLHSLYFCLASLSLQKQANAVLGLVQFIVENDGLTLLPLILKDCKVKLPENIVLLNNVDLGKKLSAKSNKQEAIKELFPIIKKQNQKIDVDFSVVQGYVDDCFERILSFLGLQWNEKTNKIEQSVHYDKRSKVWLHDKESYKIALFALQDALSAMHLDKKAAEMKEFLGQIFPDPSTQSKKEYVEGTIFNIKPIKKPGWFPSLDISDFEEEEDGKSVQDLTTPEKKKSYRLSYIPKHVPPSPKPLPYANPTSDC